MKTHRYCNRCGTMVTRVTCKELGWRMRNVLNPDRNAYKFDCKNCDEFLFRFETINKNQKIKKFGY